MSLEIQGYTINPAEINIGPNSVIYSGIKDSDHSAVIVKVIRKDHPTPEEILRIKHEYEIAKKLEHETDIVHVFQLEKIDNSYAIVMENIDASSIKEILEHDKKFNLENFLDTAIHIAEGLGHIHQNHIIHKDINPSNLMYNLNKHSIKIIDFGLAANLPKEYIEIVNARALEGTLPYLSPEQTGRMNRGIDYRTDFYSAGVTFYQMLTGKLPFDTKDPMELVHSHIAIMPLSVHEIDKTIPKAVSDIVMKLMSKKAEDRYQNANGLISDLKTCRDQLKTTGSIQTFTLGKNDIYSRFQIPEKLYGREKEIDILLSSYHEVVEGETQLMLVSGYSGIGKSSLVNEIHKSITTNHGDFISGKYDQYQKNIPYTALTHAFSELMKKILTESKEHIASIREKMLLALEGNGRIITDIIPDLISIIGEQPPVPELEPTQSLNRLNYLFQKFIRIFCTKEHPLVLFLDDLQWADTPSLNLIENLIVNKEGTYLLIIGAYRSNEVDKSHSLVMMLDKLKKQNSIIKSIELGPISKQDIEALLSDTLHHKKNEVSHLAALLQEKTAGNPFFLIQLLNSFYKEGLIYFDSDRNQFKWDSAGIEAKQISDNVVEVMIGKLREMNQESQKALEYAACIGNQFDLELLANIIGKSIEETLQALQESMHEGYIICPGESYLAQNCHFAHDRIQQAAYALMDENERQKVHFSIATLLLKNKAGTIFDIAGHLNSCQNIVTDKKEIAEINIKASIAANEAGAFEPALIYAIQALKSVNDSLWETDYPLMISLYVQATHCSFLCAKYGEMDKYAKMALARANNIVDTMKITQTQILANTAQQKFVNAIDLAIDMLQKAGIELPKNPTMRDFIKELTQLQPELQNKSMDDLLMLPEMTDEKNKLISGILKSAMAPAFQASPLLFLIVSCTMASFSLKYGHTLGSAAAYVTLGVILCKIGDVEKGYAFGELATRLVDKYHDEGTRTMVNFVARLAINYWKDPIHSFLNDFIENFKGGLSRGDFEYGCYSLNRYLSDAILSGIPLPSIAEDARKYLNISIKHGQNASSNSIAMALQVTLNLMDANVNKAMVIGEAYNEETMLAESIQRNDLAGLSIFYTLKLMLQYYLDDDQFVPHADVVETQPTFVRTCYYFYEGLMRIRLYEHVSFLEKLRSRRAIKEIIKNLKTWSVFSPENYLHRALILEAEYQFKIKRKLHDAASLYKQAIHEATKSQFLNEAALANELTAKFYLSQNFEKVARLFLQEARYTYSVWGAKAKVAQLEATYPKLLHKTPNRENAEIGSTIQGSSTLFSSALDISSIQKSSMAISSTIILPDLLKKMMHIAIENAGAEKSYLLLNKAGHFTIEAESNINSDIIESRKMTEDYLPISIINYVIHSKKPMVLDDARHSAKFFNDDYIKRKQPISILALPLINQGEITAVLYLENNLLEGAFTEEHLYVLNLLSSQMAISIDNARLYENTKALNISFERFLPADFLSLLKKNSVLDIRLGDHLEETMSIIFADIRNFTSRSEKMDPQQNFNFINSVLKVISPIIRKHHGFVDKYIGDAIMGLFPKRADDAFLCAIEMQKALNQYNEKNPEQEPVKIGIGINTGLVMLGTVGEKNRMNATVISDAVNIASRVESLTKTYQTPILFTESTYQQLQNAQQYEIEEVDSVLVKGKAEKIKIYKLK